MSLPSDLKEKLSKIIQDRRDTQRRAEYVRMDHTSLELIIPGQPISAGSGEFYIVRRELDELYSDADTLVRRYCQLFIPDLHPELHKLNNDLRKLISTDSAKVMFLDAETTGFSNTPLFLVGIMYFNGESLIIDQLFARDYSEEANLLHYLSELAPGFDTVVTFNGKSFDVPFIRDRMIYHRKKFEWTHNHVDILHHSRRRWKGEVPDCKLQTLESYICHRQRMGDLPSALVPEVYREFVRSGDTQLLADIFHHNALDLITLTELTIMLVISEP